MQHDAHYKSERLLDEVAEIKQPQTTTVLRHECFQHRCMPWLIGSRSRSAGLGQQSPQSNQQLQCDVRW